jgi:hypothetical protein
MQLNVKSTLKHIKEIKYLELKTGYDKLGKMLWKFYEAVKVK